MSEEIEACIRFMDYAGLERLAVPVRIGTQLIALGFDPERLTMMDKLPEPDYGVCLIDTSDKEPNKGPRNRWGQTKRKCK